MGLLNFMHLFEIISVIRNVSNLLFLIDVRSFTNETPTGLSSRIEFLSYLIKS